MLKPAKDIQQLAQRRIADFQAALRDQSSRAIYRKQIRDIQPAALTEEGIAKVQSLFQNDWGVEPQSIRFVGSSAKGFSIKPTRRWGFFDMRASDIDVAVVDRELFDNIWQDVHEYVDRQKYWNRLADFKNNLFNGWIRPDVLPRPMADKWFDFFRAVQAQRTFGDLKLRAGLWPSEYYLETYQCIAIEACREAVV